MMLSTLYVPRMLKVPKMRMVRMVRDLNGAAVLGSLVLVATLMSGCHDRGPSRIYSVANGCYAVGAFDADRRYARLPTFLAVTEDETGFAFSELSSGEPSAFFLKASDLGTYLFYDETGSYLVSDGIDLQRESELLSDLILIDDSFESPAEWELEAPRSVGHRFRVRHRLSGRYLAASGLVDDADQAADIVLVASGGCAEFPEATLDAEGEVVPTTFEDGSLFGIVDTHSHILSNFGFGGGGVFHGAPFHRLGIEHALPDCSIYHGVDGRNDLFGFGFDNPDDSVGQLVALATGMTPEPNHATAGYPEFTDWPAAPFSSTHQVQYYKWLERAFLGGLRLVVLHATTNSIICELSVGTGAQETRYSCNDMVGVDRIIEEAYEMEAYVDAQAGGPGEGFFRLVTSPAEAREAIGNGQMAVLLGIETSNLFDCFLTPSEEFPACTEEDVLAKLDDYHSRGIRALFPVHKYDNGFSAGDGSKAVIELGNFINSGHFTNFTDDCPDINTTFDRGPSAFPGLIMPRDEYDSPAPVDFSDYISDPAAALTPFLGLLLQPPTGIEVCQNAGATPLGEFLIEQMMQRGMILELDHMPRRTYESVFATLEANDYPAAGTHGLNNDGRLYALGGVSKTGFGTCRSDTETATVDNGFQNRIALIEDNGGFPAEGFGLDLNGFAGARGPRFGPRSGCGPDQEDPITYPFTSYAGDVVFTEPSVGNRVIDFNTEGMSHIGLLPELIQDVRGDGVTDAELEPLFKSAEGYIRMWEKAERRGAELRAHARTSRQNARP
jgi:microsomal dipeptidase-like Zn-dependent dipeptidase